MGRTTNDHIAAMQSAIPEGAPLGGLMHGGDELDLTVVNSTVDLIPADQVTPGSIIIRAFGIVTEQLGGDTEDQGVVTIYENTGTPTSLGTIAFADAGGDAVGDIRNRAALSDGAAANPATGGYKIFAKVTTATTGTSAAGKVRVYVEMIKADTTYD